METADIDISALSLEDKVRLLSGRNLWTTWPIEAAGIPSIVLTDGPHGVRRQRGGDDHVDLSGGEPATCFPAAVAVGASWDPAVAADVGRAVGREARSLGVQVVLGPGINMKRSPLCGRNGEYYSEDPLLAGALGAAHVAALQENGVGASVKHFAANNQETDRMRVSADVDERTLREIYLSAFEHVVKEARPATVMSAYNKVNGILASENRRLLTEILRDEWGFGGLVVSDWGAVSDRAAALAAGLDLEMPGTRGASDKRLLAAIEAGEIDEAEVDAAVQRVLRLAELVGPKKPPFDAEAHHALARKVAANCLVLLKNDGGVLPLSPELGRICVIGEFARTPRFQLGGSSSLTPTRVEAALDVVSELARENDAEVRFFPGFTFTGEEEDEQLRAEALEGAAGADVTVIFAGLPAPAESEGFDREHIDLPASQVALMRDVAAVSRRTVVVLSHGGVVSLEPWHDMVDAVLDCGLAGQAGGPAVADVLFGRENPSGKLAETIPLRLEDTPTFSSWPGEQGHARYGEGVMVGYRWYTTLGLPVRYPFGHGLSYTAFETSELEVEVTGADSARVTVRVANCGSRTGKHVVQVYVATRAGPVRRPARELRAFRKVELEPGERRYLSIELGRRAFAYYDIAWTDWVVAAGEYTIQIGENASRILTEKRIELDGDELIAELTLDSTVAEWFSHPVVGQSLMDGIVALLPESERGTLAEQSEMLRFAASMPMRRAARMFNGVDLTEILDSLMDKSRSSASHPRRVVPSGG